MKLNLGCGQNALEGYVNVDREARAAADVRHDLEKFPWPWADSSVDEVVLNHVLEHLGRDPEVFIGIFRELYRVCRGGALVRIVVPDPRHDNFLGDPTHVRPVTPQMLTLFSKKNCASWAKAKAANTPLAVYADVDFEIRDVKRLVDKLFVDRKNLDDLCNAWNNVIVEWRVVLEVIKDAAPESLVESGVINELVKLASAAPAGAVAEFGVYRGGTAWHLARLAREQNRALWLFDTFSGIPCADPAIDVHKVGDFGDTSLEAVKKAIPDAVFVAGVFPESVKGKELPRFAFVHVDADQYASVRAACEIFAPLMLPGGVMLFDDYGIATTPGATRAVDELFPRRELSSHGRAVVRFS
jgi:hypothetical protein